MPDNNTTISAETLSPVVPDAERPETSKFEDKRSLCLSGGGYRAMLFHLGTLWRMNEAGYLRTLARISSVSGGSITAAVLGLNWKKLAFDAAGVAQAFGPQVVAPVRNLAGKTIDVGSILGGIFLPGSIADKVAGAYRKDMFGHATLQDLPDDPRFVINATNVQTGSLWRFMKPYMRDWRVGEVKNPKVELAVAVGASSAFPPVLSPVRMDVEASAYAPPGNEPLHREPFTTRVVLTDGGVYDNLGLETIWKRYKIVFVSDGGGQMQPEGEPKGDWVRHALRVNSLIDNQVRSLRLRQVNGSLDAKIRDGAFWSIRTNIQEYAPAVALPCPFEKTQALAGVETRLKRMDDVIQERLINWGYAVCDAALRRFYASTLPQPKGFPYPGGVG